MAVIDRERWRNLEPLVDRALELAADERAAWLDELRVQSPDVAEALAALLAQEDVADRRGFLTTPVQPSLAGLTLGAYTLERPIGQGGMGSVWLARRSDGRFEGHAAVKLMNLALLSPTGEERFRREGTVLARLTHPRIARLLDAGVASTGQPYLVLEYVDGVRIDAYAQGRALSREQLIQLFLQVLDAVGHAHASLVIHRDIKPSNILVTPDGGVKLLDFGIAKLLEGDDERGGITADGRALTPDYAAPEQLRGEPITTATDVYALGVLLYLLLSGRHPTGGSHTPAEAVRGVLEVEPARLGLGDLDTIVAKALRKAPAERYQSVLAFADDLRRYLRHEPVSARPDSLAYRSRKFVRRNRWAVAAVGSIVLLLGVYAATVTVQSGRVRRALAEATLGTGRAEQVTDFMLGLFKASEGGKLLSDTVRARDLLDRGVAQTRALAGQPELQAQMLDVIGRIHTYLGEYSRAKPLLDEALAIRRGFRGESHADVATSLESLAEATGGDAARNVELRKQALALRRRLAGPDDPKITVALFDFALALHSAGDVSAAKPLFVEWMTAIAQRPREVTPERSSQLTTVAKFFMVSGQVDRAEPMMREALAVSRALYGERHAEVAEGLADLSMLLDRAQRREEADSLAREAVQIYRATYPQGHPALASTLRIRGIVLEHMQRFQEAQVLLREALAIRRRFLGSEAANVGISELDLAYALIMSGTYDEAAVLARDAVRILSRQLGEDNSMVAYARAHVGDALRGQGKLAEAEPLLLAAYAKLDPPRPVTRQWRAYALGALVRLAEAKGRPAEAARYRA
ncbi:MAG: protein kinase domain-containing protein, partial [Gemmatimonadaceae bacterium]